MEKEKFVGACLVLSMLASCQQKESLQHLSEELVLHLKASVYAPEKASRTITDESGGTVFSEKDELGFFMPEENEPVKCIIRKSKFPQNPKRSVRFSGKRTKRSVQKRKARNTQKAETKVL